MSAGGAASDRRLLDQSRQTRTMRWIMAIMLFLTVLAAALGLGTLSAAHLLDRELAGRLTVQVIEADAVARERDAARILAVLRADPAVAHAGEVDRAQLAALLKPWLGSAGDDPDLPMPALIDVDLKDAGDASVATIERAVTRVSPAARVDRRQRWMSPVSSFMDVLTALGAGLVLLMALATGAVVILAARSGLETHSDTIEVMHMLGSTDVQVARLFQRRIARDTAIGGAIGTVAALAVVGFIGMRLASLGSDLLGGVALGLRDWLLLALLPLTFALLATLAARLAVLRALGKTL
ncbi:permease [Sphingomonas koreensis]|nr:permease [Sphingomonas koreensis]